MTVILGGFADEISPDPRAQLAAALAAQSISHLELRSAWSVNVIASCSLRAGVPGADDGGRSAAHDGRMAVTNLIALSGGARPRSDQPTVMPVMLVVRASTVPSRGNTIAPSLGAGKVPGPTGAR